MPLHRLDPQPPAFVAHRDKRDRAYVPSFGFDGPRLNETHAAIHEQVGGIDGWLEPEDSLKLYELASLAPGPFLEIGTFRGKSASILATALRDAGRQLQFFSLDIDRDALEAARATLAAQGLSDRVTLVHGSVGAFFRALPAIAPEFVFLDGDHSAEGLGRDLARLESRVPEGGLLLFHDFVNPRNEDPRDRDYGVPQAIRASWVAAECEFAGTFGCTALYRRVRGPRSEDGAPQGPPIMELMPLDRASVRLLVRVLRPGKRLLRRALRRSV